MGHISPSEVTATRPSLLKFGDIAYLLLEMRGSQPLFRVASGRQISKGQLKHQIRKRPKSPSHLSLFYI